MQTFFSSQATEVPCSNICHNLLPWGRVTAVSLVVTRCFNRIVLKNKRLMDPGHKSLSLQLQCIKTGEDMLIPQFLLMCLKL